MSPRRKNILPKSCTALEYQNRSHDISKRQTSLLLCKTDLSHDSAQTYILSFIHFKLFNLIEI